MSINVEKMLANGYSKEDILKAVEAEIAAKEAEATVNIEELEENYLNAAVPYFKALGMFKSADDDMIKEIIRKSHRFAMKTKEEMPRTNLSFLRDILG